MPGQHVLIVDDDKDIARLFQMVLSLMGFECEVVHSARECLARLALSAPDIVLLDMRLGLELSGQDILLQIRANPRFLNTRVVVITGYPSMAEPISGLSDLVLLKPVEIDQLKTLIQRLASMEGKPGRGYFRDQVTGLFNQEFFNTRLEHAYERYKRREDFRFAVVVFYLEFDSPGEDETEPIFNALIRAAGERLAKSFRPTDTLARVGRGKFLSLHEDLKQPDDLKVITERLAVTVLQPYYLPEATYLPRLRMGAAMNGKPAHSALDLLDIAERSVKPVGLLTNQSS